MIKNPIYEKDVYEQLISSNFDFKDKRCLDIGTRDGLNCLTLINLGAEKVIGIDIDNSKFKTLSSQIKLIKINLLDYEDTQLFDVITCFLWNMPIQQYQIIMDKIKLLLQTNGTIFIGFHDSLYKYGYKDPITNKYVPETGSIPELIEKNFSCYSIINKNSRFQWIITAKNPK